MKKDLYHNYRTIHSIVAENARRIPDKVYVYCIDQDKSITYGELYSLTNQMAHFFKEKGFKANDRILMLSENSVEFMSVFIGVLCYGATIATANVEMNVTHLMEIVRAVNPKIVLYQGGLKLERLRDKGAPGEWIVLGKWQAEGGNAGFFGQTCGWSKEDDVPEVCTKEDLAVIFYTSGTEAKPKGVIQTHASVYYNYDATADVVELRQDDRMLDCRSYSWLSAQNMSLGGPLTRGATVIMTKRFSQRRYFEWLRTYKITIGISVPTMINMLINRPIDFKGADNPNLRFIMSSSAPLLAEPWKRFEEMYGVTLCQSYGCSEGGLMAGHRGDKRKIGTVGEPLKYQEIQIVDGKGKMLPQGEIGEIVISGGTQRSYGYLYTDGSIKALSADRHHTGDLGFFDEDGHLHVTGRLKDVIIRGGVNISPVEIDSVLTEHPDIVEAATVGIPDPIYGEEVVSFVSCKLGKQPPAASVLTFCSRKLAKFKVPKEVIFCDVIPRNSHGKLDRNALSNKWKHTHPFPGPIREDVKVLVR